MKVCGLVLFGLLFLPARDVGVARPVGRARPRRGGGRRQIHLGRNDQLGAVAIVDVRLVLAAAEAEYRADADPQRRRAVVAGRRRRRRQAQPDEARGARRSSAAPDLPKRHRRHCRKPLLAVAATRPARAETAVPHFWLARQSGESKAWNASNPRFASAAEGALLPRRREKWDSPRSRIARARSVGSRSAHAPPGAPRARRRRPRRAEEAVDDQQRDAEIDRRVGEVEDEEVAAERVQVEEVDDRAVDQPIVAVADRAADDQAEAEADQRARARATATARSAR